MSRLPFLLDAMSSRLFTRGWPNENQYIHPWKLVRYVLEPHEAGSQVLTNKNNFQVNVDVQEFSPEDINVKMTDNEIIIEGKHEEKRDGNGYISRQFMRSYSIPEGHDMETAKSMLTDDGILTITVERNKQAGDNFKSIPITRIENKQKSITDKPQEDKPQD